MRNCFSLHDFLFVGCSRADNTWSYYRRNRFLETFQLHIALTSEANKRITIDKSELPWATRYSMVLVVVKADGECLEKVLPVEDPPMGKTFLGPLQTLRENLDLEGIFKKFDEARQKSDLHLFWAYQVPNELNSVHWVGGWIVISKDRNP